MGNLCSLIDCDSIDVPSRTTHYQPEGGVYQPERQHNQLASSLDQKRSSHSSSPDRRGNFQRDAAHGAPDQCDPGLQQQDNDGRRGVVLEEEAHEDRQLQQASPTPFSWTKGELIGIGAFGRVFSGLNNVTGELVAVKQVSFAKDETLQGRVAEHIKALEAEVAVLKTLKHENIVQYLGTERTEDSIHIFLEYVPGGSIASLLAKFGPFQESVIRVYTRQILRGLEYLHQGGIMHRDIKGANILVDKKGTVKLADFGASKKIEDLATVGSGCKSIRGTPYWMAPEVIKQTGHGRPADIWSVGCTVIEMATGKPPWSSYAAPVAAMFQIASSKDPPPLPEHLSVEAKDFLLLCFNRVARDRANATRLLKHPFVAGGFSSSCPANSSSTAAVPAAITPQRPYPAGAGAAGAPITPVAQQQGSCKPPSPGTPMAAGEEAAARQQRLAGGRLQPGSSMQQRHPQQHMPRSQQQQQQQQQHMPLVTPRGVSSCRQAYTACNGGNTPGQQQQQQQQRRASPMRQQQQQQQEAPQEGGVSPAGSSPGGAGLASMRGMALHSSMYMRGEPGILAAAHARLNTSSGLTPAQQQHQRQQAAAAAAEEGPQLLGNARASTAAAGGGGRSPWGLTANARGPPQQAAGLSQPQQQQQQPPPDIMGPLRSNAAGAGAAAAAAAAAAAGGGGGPRTFADWNPMEEPAWAADGSQQQQGARLGGSNRGTSATAAAAAGSAHRRRATAYDDEDEDMAYARSRMPNGGVATDAGSVRASGDASLSPADRHSSSSAAAAAEDAVRGRDSPKALSTTRNQSHPDLCHPALHRVSDTSSTGTRKTSAGASGAGGSGASGTVAASTGSEDLQAWLAVADPSGQRKAGGGQRAAAAAAAGFAAAAAVAAAAAAEDEDDDVRISKRAQWEHEVFEELARHRMEHRARGALGSLTGQ